MIRLFFISFLFFISINKWGISQECSQKEYLEIVTKNFLNDFDSVGQELKKSNLCTMFRYYKHGGVPERPLRQALNYYSKNYKKLTNKRYISIADYSQDSRNERFYLLDLERGTLKQFKVSHGSGAKKINGRWTKNGGSNKDLKSCQHSDGTRTNMTRPGFFKTGVLYKSIGSCKAKKGSNLYNWRRKRQAWKKLCSHQAFTTKSGKLEWGWPDLPGGKVNALRLHGQNSGINDKAFNNGVVMHGAWYNTQKTQKINKGAMGRSYGCPAFEPADNSHILPRITGGSLYYSYLEGKCDEDMKVVNYQNKGWESFCK